MQTNQVAGDLEPQSKDKEYRERFASDEAQDEAPRSRLRFSSCLDSYEQLVQRFQTSISNKWMIPMIRHAAFHPYLYIVVTLIISLTLPAVSFATGSIQIETNTRITAVPQNSYPVLQDNWVRESPFGSDRISKFLLHNGGENVLTWEAVNQVYDVLDGITHVDGYSEICSPNPSRCRFLSVTNMWSNRTEFDNLMADMESEEARDELVRRALSSRTFADGSLVPRDALFGRLEVADQQDDEQLLISADSLRTLLAVSLEAGTTAAFGVVERNLGELSSNFQLRLENEGSSLMLEMFNPGVLDDELEGPVLDDLPLFYAAVVLMSIFTALAFSRFRRDGTGRRCVQSSALLGIGATVTVLLSILTGYGLCTLTGFPITTLTQILPFILIGIGLDDAFVLMGALSQTSPSLPMETRMRKMARNAGPSIVVTSVTDTVAFALGALFTSIPGIRWFCYYAVICIVIDFLYQTTFFIALMALDLRRQDAGRRDCLICLRSAPQPDEDPSDNSETVQEAESAIEQAPKVEILQRRMMRVYAKFLLKPWVKVVVLVSFFSFFVGMAISASTAKIGFDITDFLSDDASTTAFVEAEEEYFMESGGGLPSFFYVREVDQSDPEVQRQMTDFMQDVVDLEFFDEFPRAYWVNDLNTFVSAEPALVDLSFEVQLAVFLSIEPFRSLYAPNILRDEDGSVIASRIPVTINVDRLDVQEQVAMLKAQRQVTLKQPLNQNVPNGKEPLFLFYREFPIFKHYQIIPRELTTSLIVALAAVALVSMLFFPHPTGTLLSVIVVAMVNVELVGIIPLAGFTINTVTVLLLIMAIGLVVDYCLHIVDSYLQCDRKHWSDRNQRTEAALVEIGSSIFLGGFSTFLGVTTLAFASGQIFFTFFVMFISMVTLGLGYGLILLPVLLSLVGPSVAKEQVRMHSTTIFATTSAPHGANGQATRKASLTPPMPTLSEGTEENDESGKAKEDMGSYAV